LYHQKSETNYFIGNTNVVLSIVDKCMIESDGWF